MHTAQGVHQRAKTRSVRVSEQARSAQFVTGTGRVSRIYRGFYRVVAQIYTYKPPLMSGDTEPHGPQGYGHNLGYKMSLAPNFHIFQI